jgi:CBS domain containing-hemolysin-like protein
MVARRLLARPIKWVARVAQAADPDGAVPQRPVDERARGLRGRRARDLMRPRTEIVALPLDADVAEVRRVVRAERYSRYPVYRADLDDVVGIFLAKDLWLHDEGMAFVLAQHVRSVPYVPDTREAERVLDDLRRSRAHMAVVLDEYGGTSGIVTLEDLIEQVVGDINDEYDMTRRQSVETNGVLELDAAMSLADVRSEYGLAIPRGDWTTLGGFVFGELGRLARIGDRVPIESGQLEVVAMDGRRVAAVRVLADVKPAVAPPARATSLFSDREVRL